MGYVSFKTRSLGQISEKPYVHSRGHIFSPIIMKLGQNVCLDESQTCLEIVQVRSKTRSEGQILEEPCVRSRGHIFRQIIVKSSQNVCLDEIFNEFENRLCRVKQLGH